MQTLSERHGTPTVDRALRFLSIRLKSRPETKDLAPDIEAARKKVREADDAWVEVQEQRQAATAELTYVDTLLDLEVAGLVREVNVMTVGKLDDPRRQKLFPTTPSQAMAGVGGDIQTRFVKTIISYLKEDADFGGFKEQAKPLEKRLKAIEDAKEKRDALYVPEAQALAARRLAVDEARRIYNLCHPRLTLLFPKDKALVESFFTQLTARVVAVEDDAVPVEPVTP